MASPAIAPNDPLREFVLLILPSPGSAGSWCRDHGRDHVVIMADLLSVAEYCLHLFKLKSAPKYFQKFLITAFSL